MELQKFTEEMFFATFEWYFIPCALLGMAIFLLTEIVKVKMAKAEGFNWKFWWKKNDAKTYLSVLTAIASLLIMVSYGIMNIAFAVILGFCSDAFWKMITSNFKKNIEKGEFFKNPDKKEILKETEKLK